MIEAFAVYFSLVLARVAAFVTVLPVLGGRHLPRSVKAGLALALTLLWSDAAPESLGSGGVSWVGFGLAVLREILLGGLLGYALGLFLVPAQVAGEFLTQEMGLAFGNQVGALGESSSGALTQIFEIVATMIFFSLDGHHAFLEALYATFLHYPVGGWPMAVPTERVLIGVAATEEWGLLLAAPVALCLFLTTVVLALLTRAAPQLNLYSVGFPLRLGVGLLAVLLLLPGIVAGLVSLLSRCAEIAARLV